MFQKATRLKLRFESVKGLFSVEDLWDLPLTSNAGRANLDDIARSLHKQLKNGDDVSFVNKEQKSDELIQLKFDIVKTIIEVRLAENAAALIARDNSEKKQQLLGILAQRENEQLSKLSPEEIRELIKAL